LVGGFTIEHADWSVALLDNIHSSAFMIIISTDSLHCDWLFVIVCRLIMHIFICVTNRFEARYLNESTKIFKVIFLFTDIYLRLSRFLSV